MLCASLGHLGEGRQSELLEDRPGWAEAGTGGWRYRKFTLSLAGASQALSVALPIAASIFGCTATRQAIPPRYVFLATNVNVNIHRPTVNVITFANDPAAFVAMAATAIPCGVGWRAPPSHPHALVDAIEHHRDGIGRIPFRTAAVPKATRGWWSVTGKRALGRVGQSAIGDSPSSTAPAIARSAIGQPSAVTPPTQRMFTVRPSRRRYGLASHRFAGPLAVRVFDSSNEPSIRLSCIRVTEHAGCVVEVTARGDKLLNSPAGCRSDDRRRPTRVAVPSHLHWKRGAATVDWHIQIVVCTHQTAIALHRHAVQ